MSAKLAREGCDGWKPDVLHAHDWQAGFAPAYLTYLGTGGVGSVITVHNIAFQGWAPATMMGALRLPPAEFHAGALEYYGGLSSLKAGLVCSDRITTVSETYAAELMRPEFGMGLEGVIAARSDVVRGILNGVDTDLWNPEVEALPYTARAMKGKAANRAALCAEFGLQVAGPLAILVSRLTDQKGIDLVAGAMPEFLEAGGGLVVLGSGDPALEGAMRGLAARWPGRAAVHIGYDEALSHRLFAGGDAVLVPSRFEPCGLTQMYGLRYGTVPVVSMVGGRAGGYGDPRERRRRMAAGAATGIVFPPGGWAGLRAQASAAAWWPCMAIPKSWTSVQRERDGAAGGLGEPRLRPMRRCIRKADRVDTARFAARHAGPWVRSWPPWPMGATLVPGRA